VAPSFSPRILMLVFIVLHGSIACAWSQRQEIDLSGQGWHLWRDTQASWQNDELFAPGTDLAKIPANPPTGGWNTLDQVPTTAVSVPGTVEEYLYHWDPAKPENKLSQGMTGVSWWFRTFDAPQSLSGKRVTLEFESARLRAEIYLDQKLVGYNLVEGAPFSVDLTDLLKARENAQLAVRITSPGGIWSWEDFKVMRWGKAQIPVSHGFSGITGGVKLCVTDPVHMEDVYVQNTPSPREVNAQVTLRNDSAAPSRGSLEIRVVEKADPAREVAREVIEGVGIPVGESVRTVKLSAPGAKLWDLDHPNLYVCRVGLKSARWAPIDALSQVFGFRWFAPEGIGKDAVFRLNGKRIVVRTSISWSFWPINGLFPTPELAEKQIADAKVFGLNMLNFHRCIGSPVVLDKADEMGLLYFEEPGNYVDGSADPFCELLLHEKLMRMVRRDRSHPSLVIYNMINEQWNIYGADKNQRLFDTFKADMAAAHRLDPSRTIVLASSWARKPAGSEEPVKLNMRPFDDRQYFSGWFDFHRAGGPEVWKQDFYRSPEKHYGLTANAGEIVYWGEEGAVAAPPRLALIKDELDAAPNKGWDGEIYLDWYHRFDDYLTRKDLRAAFPTVDSFTVALSAVSMEQQGRKIEDTRICNLNDGYAVNGWEAEPYEDHSGVVDCFRNPKGDPTLISYYNQPLYVAVKSRNLVLASGSSATVDFYLINEKGLAGPQTLKISAQRADGTEAFHQAIPVRAAGGETYGQLLTEGVVIPTDDSAGLWTIRASLVDPSGREAAQGREQIFVVNWKADKLTGNGAVYEEGGKVRDFLKSQKGFDVPAYTGDMGPLDWIVVARSSFNAPQVISKDYFMNTDGTNPGLRATFFHGRDYLDKASERNDSQVDFAWPDGAGPDPSIAAATEFSIRWEGNLLPPAPGQYIFDLNAVSGVATLKINGQEVVGDMPVTLAAGKPASVEIDYASKGGKCGVSLLWARPNERGEDADALVRRAARDGTTVIIADYADSWMEAVKAATNIAYNGPFKLGMVWTGAQYFAIDHPLFKGLPVNQALNWPYESVVSQGRSRYGVRVEGEQLVAGCWQSYPMDLGTAVGVIPCGRGRIVFSTLDICPHLHDPSGPADVARKLLCNYIEYAMEKSR
jgi:beta-galactosidase